jgi:predicted metal-dependent enzyme (double-stranded beta helix superfamily)
MTTPAPDAPTTPPIPATGDLTPLRDFVTDFARLLDETPDEAAVLAGGARLLESLVARQDWLPDAYALPHPDRYQQYLLHCDSAARFSVVSFVWGPGQSTPIHDHRVWGLVGVLRGSERVERFSRQADGSLIAEGEELLLQGQVDAVSPTIGDIHRVANGRSDALSVSIHVYGANIGTVSRATYSPDGTPKPFISGYANSVAANIWIPA